MAAPPQVTPLVLDTRTGAWAWSDLWKKNEEEKLKNMKQDVVAGDPVATEVRDPVDKIGVAPKLISLVPATEVSCGAHSAPTCAECPMGRGAVFCNGNCTWCAISQSCVAAADSPACQGASFGT